MALSFPASPSAGVTTSVQNGRTYIYAGNNVWELVAASGGGSGGTDTLLRSLFVPAAPTSVTASSGNAQSVVSWTAPTGTISQAPITDYAVQYSSDSGSTWTTFADGTSTTTSATVTGLTNGTPYTFRVAAVNGIGPGAWSSASSSITPAAQSLVLTLSGLKGWYDPSASGVLFSADTAGSEVTSNGGSVYRMQDLSGNGHHLKTFGAAAPTLVTSASNGKSVLAFANQQTPFQCLRSAANHDGWDFSVSNPLTIFAVWNPINDGAVLLDNLRYSWGDEEGSTRVRVATQGMPTSGQSAVTLKGPSNQRWAGATNILNNGFHVIEGVWNGTSSQLKTDGSTDGPMDINQNPWESMSSSAINLSAAMACLAIGCELGSYPAYGQRIGEIIIVQGVVSDTNRTAIRSYLKSKWGTP